MDFLELMHWCGVQPRPDLILELIRECDSLTTIDTLLRAQAAENENDRLNVLWTLASPFAARGFSGVRMSGTEEALFAVFVGEAIRESIRTVVLPVAAAGVHARVLGLAAVSEGSFVALCAEASGFGPRGTAAVLSFLAWLRTYTYVSRPEATLLEGAFVGLALKDVSLNLFTLSTYLAERDGRSDDLRAHLACDTKPSLDTLDRARSLLRGDPADAE